MSLTQSHILSAAACNALMYISRWIVGLFLALDTRYRDPSTNAAKKGEWSRRVGKHRFPELLTGKYGLHERGTLWTPPSPPVKVLTYLDIMVYGI